MENENNILKEKLRKLDISKIEFKNMINKTPFSSIVDGESVNKRNAIDSFVSHNFCEFEKDSDVGHNRSIEVQDIVKFDEGNLNDSKNSLEQ